MKRSGLQKQVLSLYKQALTLARSKNPSDNQSSIDFVRKEFRKNKDLDKKDFRRIEFLIRKAEKQLKLFSSETSAGVRSVSVPRKD